MKLRAVALAYGLGLVVVTAAWAASPKAPAAGNPAAAAPSPAATLPPRRVPNGWVPDWLMAPLSRAIADATDPRDRKAAN